MAQEALEALKLEKRLSLLAHAVRPGSGGRRLGGCGGGVLEGGDLQAPVHLCVHSPSARSFTHSFPSPAHSFTHSSPTLLAHSFIFPLLIYFFPFAHSFIYSFPLCSLIRSLTHDATNAECWPRP